MSIRRILIAAAAAALALALTAPPASAQFTPRFSTQSRNEPGQFHIGLGTNVNIGDYTSEPWPDLEAASGQLHGRLGWAIPVKAETYFIIVEVEGQLGKTNGRFKVPVNLHEYIVPTIKQRGFSIMANLTRAAAGRRTLYGAGIGYHLLTHDPLPTAAMQAVNDTFLRDPFTHIGLGGQLFYARSVGRINDTTLLMLEGRYKAAIMGGNVPGSNRNILMSEFQITLFVAAK